MKLAKLLMLSGIFVCSCALKADDLTNNVMQLHTMIEEQQELIIEMKKMIEQQSKKIDDLEKKFTDHLNKKIKIKNKRCKYVLMCD